MPSSKSIYLAGPITGLSYGAARFGWREVFYNRMKELAPHVECFSPMRAKEFLDGHQSLECAGADLDKVNNALCRPLGILARDSNDVAERDLIVANFLGAERVSIGTVWELGHAAAFRKKVVVIMEDDAPRPFPINEDCAWVAGFCEGDGCISIRGTAAQNYHQTQVIFHVNDVVLLRRVADIMKCGEIRKSLLTKAGNQTWRLSYTGDDAAYVLRAMYPWLVHKKTRAAIALEMMAVQKKRHIAGRHWARRTEDDLRVESEIMDRYQATFKPGSVPYTQPEIERGSLHNHVFVTHNYGWRVNNLEEAALIAASVLTPGI